MSLQYYKVIIITVLAPSDFSALKNFVRQPVHETRSKFCFVDSKFVIRNVFSSPTRNFFYLNPPVSNQNNSLGGRQVRLLAEREKFAQHVMVSAGVCFGGNGRLHFVDESAKVDSAYRYYVGRLLPSLVDDCARLLQYFAHLPARHTQLVPPATFYQRSIVTIGLYRTVSEIDGKIGRKSPIPPCVKRPDEGVPLGIWYRPKGYSMRKSNGATRRSIQF